MPKARAVGFCRASKRMLDMVEQIKEKVAEHDKNISVLAEQLKAINNSISEIALNTKMTNEYIKKVDIVLEKMNTQKKGLERAFNKIDEIEKRQTSKGCTPFVELSHKITALEKEDGSVIERLNKLEGNMEQVTKENIKAMGFVTKAEKIIWGIIGTAITVGFTYYFSQGGM
jgi:chromosome segregation ATPase